MILTLKIAPEIRDGKWAVMSSSGVEKTLAVNDGRRENSGQRLKTGKPWRSTTGVAKTLASD